MYLRAVLSVSRRRVSLGSSCCHVTLKSQHWLTTVCVFSSAAARSCVGTRKSCAIPVPEQLNAAAPRSTSILHWHNILYDSGIPLFSFRAQREIRPPSVVSVCQRFSATSFLLHETSHRLHGTSREYTTSHNFTRTSQKLHNNFTNFTSLQLC
jgi:hypothetical protein